MCQGFCEETSVNFGDLLILDSLGIQGTWNLEPRNSYFLVTLTIVGFICEVH